MNILPGLKTCRKGLHQYSSNLKRCPFCQENWLKQNAERKKESDRKWRERNADRVRKNARNWYEQNTELTKERSRQWRKKYAERAKESVRKWRKENAERQKKHLQRWRKNNQERDRQNKRKWYEQNKELVRENNRKWCKQNPDLNRACKRRWDKANPAKLRAKQARRRARIKQATPPWAEHAAINQIFDEACRLERETGIPYHVDHIYPLYSPYLCGLHIAENLQAIPKSENLKKSNKTWPGQLDCQRLPPHLNGFDTIEVEGD